MKTYLLKAGVRQAIAKAGETDIAVAYNAKTWVDEYPAGNPQLMVTTPGGKRVPVTVDTVDNLITGQVPNELLTGPGVYSYVFVWTSGSTQLESGRCECLVLGSNLAADLVHDSRRTPDWAERIFLAAEVIEGAIDGAIEARNTAADMAAEAAESEANAAGSAEEAEDSATLADQKATAAAESAEDAAASAAALHPENYVAQAFSASSAYSAGTYVMYDGYLYRLTADHDADVTWENTAKVQVKVADDVGDLKSAFRNYRLGVDTTFSGTSGVSSKFDLQINKGQEVFVTNNTTGNISLNVYKSGVLTQIRSSLAPGVTHYFYAVDDYDQIGGWFAQTGTISVLIFGNDLIFANEKACTRQSVIESNRGVGNIGLYGTYDRGNMYHGASGDTEYMYRVRSNDIVTADRDLVLNVKAGFKYFLNFFEDGVYSSDTGWLTGGYTISKDTQFKICIARTTEDSTEFADINEFVSAIYFETAEEEKIHNLSDSIDAIATNIQHLPFLGIDFTVEAGKQHSSTTDQLAVSIAQGAEYMVALSSGILYAFYSDGTYTNVPVSGTATKDIVAFGVYLDNTSGESPITVSMRVASNPMGADIYNKSIKAIDMAKGSPFVGTQFNVAAGAQHSSANDQLLVNIKAGYAYRVSKTDGILYAYYSDGTLESVASFGTAAKDIIAFGVYYNNQSGSDPLTISLKAASNPIGADVFDAAGVIPEYYKDHLVSAESRIRANMMEVGKDGETFIFITDLHWAGNAKTSPSLVKHVMSKLNINLLLCGGDIIGEGEKDVMAAQMVDAIKAFSPTENIVMPCLFGNHDGNWNDYNNQRQYPERRFTLSDQYALMQKQAENLVTYITDDKWNFYFDVKNTGTRIIGLDTGEYDTGEAQGGFTNYQDLSDCLMQTPAGYHIVILAHWLYQNGKTTSCENLESLIDAYNSADTVTIDGATYSFANAPGKIMLMMGGHLHKDMDWTTPDGVPVVLTDCDTYAGTHSDAPHSRGTIGEQAFDVVTINYNDNAEKTVKIVRIGRGEDRTFPN